MSVGCHGTVAELCSCGRRKALLGSEEVLGVHGLSGNSLCLIWKFWWGHEKINFVFREKKHTEIQWEDPWSAFPQVFSSPQFLVVWAELWPWASWERWLCSAQHHWGLLPACLALQQRESSLLGVPARRVEMICSLEIRFNLLHQY